MLKTQFKFFFENELYLNETLKYFRLDFPNENKNKLTTQQQNTERQNPLRDILRFSTFDSKSNDSLTYLIFDGVFNIISFSFRLFTVSFWEGNSGKGSLFSPEQHAACIGGGGLREDYVRELLVL